MRGLVGAAALCFLPVLSPESSKMVSMGVGVADRDLLPLKASGSGSRRLQFFSISLCNFSTRSVVVSSQVTVMSGEGGVAQAAAASGGL